MVNVKQVHFHGIILQLQNDIIWLDLNGYDKVRTFVWRNGDEIMPCKCSFHLLAKSVDEVHPRDEKELTKEQMAQKKADENYFHTNRDINKDGVMDKVTRQMCIKWRC